MNTSPTHEDVQLPLRVYELRNNERLQKAQEWLLTVFEAGDRDEFPHVCPSSWETYADFQRAVSFWRMVACFITSGLLNGPLFFPAGLELPAVWEKIRHLVPEMRIAQNNPGLYRELETAAEMARQHLESLKA